MDLGVRPTRSGGGQMTIAPTETTAGGRDDAALVLAASAGDRTAFAAIYDRYADRLHDFCIGMLRDRDAAADCVQDTFVIAATKLTQLREPDRLRSWLYAIARSEALARIRARRREQPSEELPEMASAEPELATLAARCELADLINDACGGLSDRDRTVLELAYRQDLSGPELADALGVTHKNANNLVERLRDTIARSLGALLVSRRVKADPSRCPELAALLDGWDGDFTVLMRKRIARHIDGCHVCTDERSRMITPAALLGAAPMLIPAPAWLRHATLTRAPLPGSPTPPTGQSWWPESDFDVSDLTVPATQVGHTRGRVRLGLGAGLVLMGVVGGALLAMPVAVHTVPTHSPASVDTTSTAAPLPPVQRTAATTTAPPAPPPPPPPPPTPELTSPPAAEPTTTEPSAVERTRSPSTSPQPGPSSFEPPPVESPKPSQSVTEEPPVNQGSQQPEPSPEPSPPNAPNGGSEPPPKPGVPKTDPGEPKHQGPVQCPPNRPCTPNAPPVLQ